MRWVRDIAMGRKGHPRNAGPRAGRRRKERAARFRWPDLRSKSALDDDCHVADIIDGCLHHDPNQRPTLDRLAAALATLTAHPASPGDGPAQKRKRLSTRNRH